MRWLTDPRVALLGVFVCTLGMCGSAADGDWKFFTLEAAGLVGWSVTWFMRNEER